MSSISKSVSGSSSEDDVVAELRRGPWTLEEDTLLVHYISCHGEGRWNLLAKRAGLRRTGKSCRLRWLNYLKPDVKRGNLSPREQLLILELHSKWGNRWSKIAQHLPGRTDNEIKNYWRTRVQKQARNLNMEANSQAFQDMIRCFWMPRLLQKIEGSANSYPTQFQNPESNPLPARIVNPDPVNYQLGQNHQEQSSDSEHGTSSCISSSESINISHFSEYPTSPFQASDSHGWNNCYHDVMESMNMAYANPVIGDLGNYYDYPGAASGCQMDHGNWVDDGLVVDQSLWNSDDQLWRNLQERR